MEAVFPQPRPLRLRVRAWIDFPKHNSGPAEFARAALESVGYQTRDLLMAMRADWGAAADGVLRVDGGMTASDWTMQFLSDILGAPVDRPKVTETTALGAAYLVPGLGVGRPAGQPATLAAPPAWFSLPAPVWIDKLGRSH